MQFKADESLKQMTGVIKTEVKHKIAKKVIDSSPT